MSTLAETGSAMDSLEARTGRSSLLEPPPLTLSRDSIGDNANRTLTTTMTTTTKGSVSEQPRERKPTSRHEGPHAIPPQVSSMNYGASEHNGSSSSQVSITTTRVGRYDIMSSCQPWNDRSGATKKTAPKLSTPPHASSSSTRDTEYSTMQKTQQLLRAARNDAAKAFEIEKDWILSCIPNSIKDIFGQIGFAKWGGKMLPALVLNPYLVPPDPVRIEFLKRFEKARKSGRLDKLPLIIYWYGVTDESQMYSFISQRSFISYEQGIAKGLVIKGNALNEVEQDLAKAPSERRQGVVGFVEGYQTLTLEEVEEVLVQDSVALGVNGHAAANLEVDEGKAKETELEEEWNNHEVEAGILKKQSPKRDRKDDKRIVNDANEPNKDRVPKRRRVTSKNDDRPRNVSSTAAMAEMEKILKERDQARHQAEQKCNDRLTSLVAALSDKNAKLTRRISILEQQNATQTQELSKQKVLLAQRQREWFKEKEMLKQQHHDDMEDLSNQHNQAKQALQAENISLRATITYYEHKEQKAVRSFSSHSSSETNKDELWL